MPNHGLPSVVETARGDFQRLRLAFAGDAINETVFACYSARPKALHIANQWFGFANATEGGSLRVLYQGVDALRHCAVMVLPK
jgi:hypothetical protein